MTVLRSGTIAGAIGGIRACNRTRRGAVMSNEMMSDPNPEWCIAVFARNEAARIGDCLTAIAKATGDVLAGVILIINGASDETSETALGLLPTLGLRASVYKIEFGCKSHAMNVFIHDLRPKAKIYSFVDATTFIEPNALRALAAVLNRRSDIAAVSGLPINGRGAARMRREAIQNSKLFGQLFAVRQSCLDELSLRGRRLPIGLYRCDGLFVGFICWETDGIAHERAMPRIATVPEAEWRIRPISWFGWKDITVGFNRLVRQARGRLENQSWNPILWTRGFGALPRFANDMISEWLKTNSPQKEPLQDRFFTWLALRQVRQWRRPGEDALLPRKIL